jgi:hypothetical protein
LRKCLFTYKKETKIFYSTCIIQISRSSYNCIFKFSNCVADRVRVAEVYWEHHQPGEPPPVREQVDRSTPTRTCWERWMVSSRGKKREVNPSSYGDRDLFSFASSQELSITRSMPLTQIKQCNIHTFSRTQDFLAECGWFF